MKTKNKVSENNVSVNNSITVFRYKMADLENKLIQEHESIKNNIATPLGKDLGNMKPSKPEADCEKDVYSGVINGAYSKMMMSLKKEMQSGIESHHIIADNLEANKKLKEAEAELEKLETDYRLKKRELEKCDKVSLLKEKRYKRIRPIIIFATLLDIAISGASLQNMGYPLWLAYSIGLGIGVFIFLLAENLSTLINYGKTSGQQRLIGFIVFVVVTLLFYVLGTFRASTFSNNPIFGSAAGPLYFVCINIFFTGVATIVVWIHGLSQAEKKTLDKFKTTQEDVLILEKDILSLKSKITDIRKEQKESELARKQIIIYAQDMQELVQRLFEESQKTFYTTNLIHRSDGKTPKFFENDIPMLPSFYKDLNI